MGPKTKAKTARKRIERLERGFRGCPRITTDDGPRFHKPMLTPGEYEIAIGNKPLEDLSFDTFHGTW